MKALRHLTGIVLLLVTLASPAHDIRPILLQLDEHGDGVVTSLLKVPVFRDAGVSAARPVFDERCQPIDYEPATQTGEILSQRWRLQCTGPLHGLRVGIQGFSPLAPDALMLVRYRDGTETSHVLNAGHATVILEAAADTGIAFGLFGYLAIGIEHILQGLDHLLFLLGLLLVILRADRGLRVLIMTVTAFTVAHSLTLGLAMLVGISLPAGPVEALIALSVLMLALELARGAKDSVYVESSLTFRKPWLVAFVFGLLHGFGFAGALADVGLPEAARATALLLFNLGVELGQLGFILLFLISIRLLSRIVHQPLARLSPALTLALGGLSAAWLMERLPGALFVIAP